MDELSWLKLLKKEPVSDFTLGALKDWLKERGDERHKNIVTAKITSIQNTYLSNPYQTGVSSWGSGPLPERRPPSGWYPEYQTDTIWGWEFLGKQGSTINIYGDEEDQYVDDEEGAREDLAAAIINYLLEN